MICLKKNCFYVSQYKSSVLILFADLSYSCRINRILESPRGNALLVGVGGSGKQSLARLAAYISALEVFQITLRKGYSIADLKVCLAAKEKETCCHLCANSVFVCLAS